MKKILFSERNFAAFLFILVLVAFSFAHEDSKKRDVFYNTSVQTSSSSITSVNSEKPKQKDVSTDKGHLVSN